MISLRPYRKTKYSSSEHIRYAQCKLREPGSSRLRSNNNNLPKAYQKGYAEFYKLKFKVTPDVLIPRPETELLVDGVLSFIRLNLNQGLTLTHLTILDLGTGSGNIAISLAKNLSHLRGVTILATDISDKALKIAKQNAKFHGVEKQIRFIQSDLLSSVIPSNEGIQLTTPSSELDPRTPGVLASSEWRLRGDDNLIIVTNLPYIPSARIPYLDSSVKDFEPEVALDGGKDGFELYRKLFQQIKQLSTPGVNLNTHSWSVYWKPKLIIGEIDYTHKELASYEAQKYFPDYQVEIKTDLAHKQRILLVKLLTTN